MRKHFTLLFSIIFTGYLVAQPPTSGLVAHFPLNGDFTNSNSFTPIVTSVSAATNNMSVANNAVSFTNTSFGGSAAATSFASINTTAAINFGTTSSFTIGFAFKIDNLPAPVNPSPSTNFVLFENNFAATSGYAIWGLRTSAAGNPIILRFNFRNGSIQTASATTPIDIGTWYHILVTVNNGASAGTLYINGIAQTTTTTATGTATPSYSYRAHFGTAYYNPANSNNTYNPFNGTMDELRIYNRVLTAAEIGEVAGAALPLKLIDFNATLNANTTMLNWQTAQETNTSHFEIERSTDGTNFSTVKSIASAGTSLINQHYAANDDISALTNIAKIYYRLKMVDRDGAFTYSKIIAINGKAKQTILTLLPNPVVDVVQVNIKKATNENVVINVLNANGYTVQQYTVKVDTDNFTKIIDVHKLAVGTYFIHVIGKKEHWSESFVKQ